MERNGGGMTSYEAEATSNYGSDPDRGGGWYQLLVPIVAAALVLALGLAVVGLTSGRDDAPSPNRPAAAESLQR
jgi:hypothetical protein